jgi:hypothetical protein
MEEFVVKFNLLNPFRKKELLDFLDFLLKKQEGEETFSFANYKKEVQEVSSLEPRRY